MKITERLRRNSTWTVETNLEAFARTKQAQMPTPFAALEHSGEMPDTWGAQRGAPLDPPAVHDSRQANKILKKILPLASTHAAGTRGIMLPQDTDLHTHRA